ncbi:uncharacterized protein [Euphorbia lathyris]|uniref:uncharacterized protein isoform X1 n=2 Tax=Euphorbia lathyris TaxID=212925 RepID=UPI003314480E
MASLRPCRWSLDTTTCSPSITNNSPSIYTFYSFPPKPRHFTTFSLRHDSPSSTSSSSSCGSSDSDIEIRKLSNLEIPTSKKRTTFADLTEKEVDVVNSLTRNQNRKEQTLNLKSLFGRKSLLRRVVFASRKVRSIFLLNAITIVYASNIPVVKEVETIMDPAAFTVVRFVVAAIPFIPYVLEARGDRKTRNAGIELGIWLSFGYLMQALGLMTSDAGRASFISMFTVIVVPLLDGMLGAVIPARTWFGALMSLVGVGMLESSGSPPSIGDLLNFLSAACFGVHMLRTEHVSRSTSKKNFLALLGYEVCVVALFSTIWYIVKSQFDGIQTSDPSSWTLTMVWHWMVTFPWIPALYTGVFSTVLCLWIEMSAMCDVSATDAAIIYGLEPVWGAAFAWFLLGERWGTTGWIGAALVLVGSLTVQMFGSSSSGVDEETSEEVDHVLVSDKQNRFSPAPVPISYKKESNVLKK